MNNNIVPTYMNLFLNHPYAETKDVDISFFSTTLRPVRISVELLILHKCQSKKYYI